MSICQTKILVFLYTVTQMQMTLIFGGLEKGSASAVFISGLCVQMLCGLGPPLSPLEIPNGFTQALAPVNLKSGPWL